VIVRNQYQDHVVCLYLLHKILKKMFQKFKKMAAKSQNEDLEKKAVDEIL
jgi:hypothetical protein